jgi:hypothetical protein
MHHNQESVCHVGVKTDGHEPQKLRKIHVKHICSSIRKQMMTSLNGQRFVTKIRDHPGQLPNMTMEPQVQNTFNNKPSKSKVIGTVFQDISGSLMLSSCQL